MSIKLLSGCAVFALALAVTAGLAPVPHVQTPVRATKGDLACDLACSAPAEQDSRTTALKIGESTTLLIKWDETNVAAQ